MEDALFAFEITGHYRYMPTAPAQSSTFLGLDIDSPTDRDLD